jgi:hypothetical protein
MDNETQLSITDLAVIKKSIEVACSRGAFQAAEMQSVGTVYDRLSIFLDQVIRQAEAETAKSQTQGEVK